MRQKRWQEIPSTWFWKTGTRRSRWVFASAWTTEAELTFLHKLRFQNICFKWDFLDAEGSEDVLVAYLACGMHVFKRLRTTTDSSIIQCETQKILSKMFLWIPEDRLTWDLRSSEEETRKLWFPSGWMNDANKKCERVGAMLCRFGCCCCVWHQFHVLKRFSLVTKNLRKTLYPFPSCLGATMWSMTASMSNNQRPKGITDHGFEV